MSSWPKRFYKDIYYRLYPNLFGEIEDMLTNLALKRNRLIPFFI